MLVKDTPSNQGADHALYFLKAWLAKKVWGTRLSLGETLHANPARSSLAGILASEVI